MKVAEIRTRFLKFFESRGHTIVESSSLVPHNDPTLLFTNAGMVQFKETFLGHEKRPYTRAASCQRCVRAGGKHNDLENVGFTARHHTFFEMLGNFSFGDYFKEDAIKYAWEFVSKELKLPADRIYVTVFLDDDEAAEIWEKKVGMPKERIFRLGEKDNFWAMGDVGPCGPCSEIFYDRGPEFGCDQPNCGIGQCDCDRYLEFWNLVFMQFNRDQTGQLTPLPRPSVDTGMGLERIGAIIQEAASNYDIDSFVDILKKTASLAGKTYEAKAKDSYVYRIIADHARATTFLIGDGVLPSNEGRGYVLRRIMRRAIRYGRNLGFSGPFFHEVCAYVVAQMKDVYPEIVDKLSFIQKAVRAEEEQFLRTLERGLQLLDEEIQQLKGQKTLSGEVAFRLYDTFGFPLDLTRIICQEQGLGIDEAGFEKAMEQQRSQSRQNWKGSGEDATDQLYHSILERLQNKGSLPDFVGYEQTQAEGQCLAILSEREGAKSECDVIGIDDSGTLVEAVFSKTPFYGESGGQTGDRGRVYSADGNFEADVLDVQKPLPDLIVAHLKIKKGSLRVGASYIQETDDIIRQFVARNHTATHMLHWALRDTLGDHVKQAGSLVTADLLRFDFTHFQQLTDAELHDIEHKINQRIWEAASVSKQLMSKDQAIAAGAIAFFGEKYGDEVRVIKVGDFSVELCGGTHVNNTADINLFKIVNESSIASGVRRIVAYTSKRAFEYLTQREQESKVLRERLKAVSAEDMLTKIDRMAATEKDLRRELEQLKSRNLGSQLDELLAKAEVYKGVRLVTFECPGDQQGVKTLRDLADQVRQKAPDALVVLGMKQVEEGKALLLIAKGQNVAKEVKAGDMIKTLAPHIDGRGGGKPDMAQAGGQNLDGLAKVFQEAKSALQQLIG
ncbi:MAG: alanine--tRNA ligase [Oligoflexus sp.]